MGSPRGLGHPSSRYELVLHISTKASISTREKGAYRAVSLQRRELESVSISQDPMDGHVRVSLLLTIQANDPYSAHQHGII